MAMVPYRNRTVAPAGGGVPLQNIQTKPQDFGATSPQVTQAVDKALQAGNDIGMVLEAGEARIRTQQEAVQLAQAVSGFEEKANAEARRLQTEGDLSDLQTSRAYGGFLLSEKTKMLNSGAWSEGGKLRLQERLDTMSSAMGDRIAALGVQAQNKKVATTLAGEMSKLTAQAIENPGQINNLFQNLDAKIDDMAPALTPEQEIEFRSTGRREIALSVVNGYMARGAFGEAKSVLNETPGLKAMMTPDQLRSIDTRLAAADRAEADAKMAGVNKLTELRTILGREPTMAERVRAAGVQGPQGEKTLADKKKEIEDVLRRPLNEAEIANLAGLTPQKAQTDPGRLVQDRQMFVSQFGADSPQVKAFDEAANGSGGPGESDLAGMRKEFTTLSKDFVQVRDSYKRIETSAKEPSAAGDLALIFNFMKMLDPGSTVREGEFATASNAAGVDQRIAAQYNRVVDGQRLTEETRADFLGKSKALYDTQVQSQVTLENTYRELAKRRKANPDDVVLDFVGSGRKTGAGGPSGEPGDAAAGSEGVAPPRRIQIDLEGNVIGGQASAAPTKPATKGKK